MRRGDRRPLPALDVHLGRVWPGWAVRLLPSVLALTCAAVVGGGPVVRTMAVAAAVLLLWRPGGASGAVMLGVVGLWVLTSPDLLRPGGTGWAGPLRLSTLVLLTHALLQVAGLAAHVRWRARVEVGVLRRAALSLLPPQVLVQGVLVGAVVLRNGFGPSVEWLRPVAVAAAVLAVLVALPRGWLGRPR